ncbi:lipopolysaccharide biosynthesis protein [Weissella cibaria]|uniref:lipopolysaccharide biosynthesis protein n=2 Tax=Weissella cibaria TaxID=137591 RepID=UPI001E38AC3F|nr:oligosaccharide flippase family protein [Weissella cibaria]
MKTGNLVIKNSMIALFAQILTLLLSFALQSVFARTLGSEYMGLNGMFSNVLTILSFTELGIGNAIAFALYKPLHDRDYIKVAAILLLFKKVYIGVGSFLMIASFALLPFINFFIHGANVPNVGVYFLLFALNSVASYFFSYKRTLLIADQKTYLNVLNQLLFRGVIFIFQIYFLLNGNYMGFLISQILGTVLSNFIISRKINHAYAELFPLKAYSLTKEDKKRLIQSTVGGMGQKIGSIVVNNTNNLFIASFVSLSVTGIYSSYMMIITGLSVVISQFVNAITATIGHRVVDNNKKRMIELFDRHQFLTLGIAFISAEALINLTTPFVKVWLGSEFALDSLSVYLIAVNYFINIVRLSFLSFIQAMGLFKMSGLKSIFEAVINLIGCLVALVIFKSGINGLLFVTLVINLLLNVFSESYIVYKYGIHAEMPKKFLVKFICVVGYLVGCGMLISYISELLFNGQNIDTFLLRCVFTLFCSVILYMPITAHSDNLKYFFNYFRKNLLMRKEREEA